MFRTFWEVKGMLAQYTDITTVTTTKTAIILIIIINIEIYNYMSKFKCN